MSATRAPQPIPLSIRAEDLLIAAAVLAALGDRPGMAHHPQTGRPARPVRTHLLAATTSRRRQR